MKIFLLTHERELTRASNTGSIALQHAPDIVERIIWQRIDPDLRLTTLLENNQALLLHQLNSAGTTDAGFSNTAVENPTTEVADTASTGDKSAGSIPLSELAGSVDKESVNTVSIDILRRNPERGNPESRYPDSRDSDSRDSDSRDSDSNVFTDERDTCAELISAYENLIIIDSTWQESRKIINRSAYLKTAPLATIDATNNSQYKLRRNQVAGGLCTIECIIEILIIKGETSLASTLLGEYKKFNQQ